MKLPDQFGAALLSIVLIVVVFWISSCIGCAPC